MGLKTTNYKLEGFGITIPKAYARLTHVDINMEGRAFGTFEIHQTREDLTSSNSLERRHINAIIDKDLPIYTQLYNKAKEELFQDWEDDIVEEEIVSEVE